MKTVWKYTIRPFIETRVEFRMPHLARVVFVAIEQSDATEPDHITIGIWAEVNPRAVATARTFEIIGTGHPAPVEHLYCGTVQTGGLVLHVYEDPRPAP